MPPASSAVPLSQNTAPIFEFRCLFTPDIRKKAKKWQDGRLKFHTFNCRILVYDERQNYVGDKHWGGSTLEEGEELELERGILVEVGEACGKTDQSMEEVLDKVTARRCRNAETPAPSRGTMATPAAGRFVTPAPLGAGRHTPAMSGSVSKPLSALLGTPSGHHGRALLPLLSPFEDRQNAMRQSAVETLQPASKRRKIQSPFVQQGYAQKLTGAPLHFGTSHTTASASGSRGSLFARPSEVQSGIDDENLQPVPKKIVYPDSIAPKAKPRKAYEKPSKAGYAQKLTGAVLDLSSTQKANAFLGRTKSSVREDSPDVEAIISRATPDERPPVVVSSKPKAKNTATAKRASQMSEEEKQLRARLAELEAARKAAEDQEDAQDEDSQVVDVEAGNDFMDIDTVVPEKPTRIRTARAKSASDSPLTRSSRNKPFEDTVGTFVEDDDPASALVVTKNARKGREKTKASPPAKTSKKKPPPQEVNEPKRAATPAASKVPAKAVAQLEVVAAQAVQERHSSNLSEETSQASNSTSTSSTVRKTLCIKSKPKRNMLMLTARPPPPVRVPVSIVTESEPPEPSQGTKDVMEKLEQRKKRASQRKAERAAPIEVAKEPVVVEIESSPEQESIPQLKPSPRKASSPAQVPSYSVEEFVIPHATQHDEVYDFEDDILMLESPVKMALKPSTPRADSPLPEAESEEAGITYTAIDNILTRTPSVTREPSFHRITPSRSPENTEQEDVPITAPQPTLPPMSSMAFEDHTQRERKPVPVFTVTRVPLRANSSFGQFLEDERRVPATPATATQHSTQLSPEAVRTQIAGKMEVEVQVKSSQTEDCRLSEPLVGRGGSHSYEPPHSDLDGMLFDSVSPQAEECVPSTQHTALQPLPVLVESSPDIIPPGRRNRRAQKSASPSPPPRKARTTRSKAKAKPVSSSEVSSSSEAEPISRSRSLSHANEEKLAAGRTVLVKLKSHIRSKEIIRPADPFREREEYGGLLSRAQQPIIHHYVGFHTEDEDEQHLEDELPVKPKRQRKAPVKAEAKAEPTVKVKSQPKQPKQPKRKVIESEEEAIPALPKPKAQRQKRKVIESEEDEVDLLQHVPKKHDSPGRQTKTPKGQDDSVENGPVSRRIVDAGESLRLSRTPSRSTMPPSIAQSGPSTAVMIADTELALEQPKPVSNATVSPTSNPATSAPRPTATVKQQLALATWIESASNAPTPAPPVAQVPKEAASESTVGPPASLLNIDNSSTKPASAPAPVAEPEPVPELAQKSQEAQPPQPEKKPLPAPKPAHKLPQTILEAAAKKKADRARIASIFAPSRIMPTATQEERIEGDLVLAMPVLPGFKKPKTVPIVPLPKKVMSGGFEKSVREQEEDAKIGTQIESMGKGQLGEWQDGAWTSEAFDLFDWRPASEVLRDSGGAGGTVR